MNFNIRINLLAIKGAFTKEMKSSQGQVKCLVIPILPGKSRLFDGKQGLYLDLAAWESKSEYSSHLVKESVSKEEREKMSEEERKQQPTVGNMSEMKQEKASDSASAPTVEGLEDDNDLPF